MPSLVCQQCNYRWAGEQLPSKPLTCPCCHSCDWEKETRDE